MTIVCGGGSTIAHDFVATHALVSPRPASNGAILTGGRRAAAAAAAARRQSLPILAHASPALPTKKVTKRSVDS
jgi:hypothetical protein